MRKSRIFQEIINQKNVHKSRVLWEKNVIKYV